MTNKKTITNKKKKTSEIGNSNDALDRMIAGAIRKDKRVMPLHLKQTVRREIRKAASEKHADRTRRFLLTWVPVSLSAAVVLVFFLMVNPFSTGKKEFNVGTNGTPLPPANIAHMESHNETGPIPSAAAAQIRTEIQIKKKKIKILWFHKGRKT